MSESDRQWIAFLRYRWTLVFAWPASAERAARLNAIDTEVSHYGLEGFGPLSVGNRKTVH